MLMEAKDKVELKIYVDAEGNYCNHCNYLLYMGVALCQLFGKSLKTNKSIKQPYVHRCKECINAQKQASKCN